SWSVTTSVEAKVWLGLESMAKLDSFFPFKWPILESVSALEDSPLVALLLDTGVYFEEVECFLCLGLAPGVMPWGTLLALEESLGALNTTGLAVVQIANMWSVEGGSSEKETLEFSRALAEYQNSARTNLSKNRQNRAQNEKREKSQQPEVNKKVKPGVTTSVEAKVWLGLESMAKLDSFFPFKWPILESVSALEDSPLVALLLDTGVYFEEVECFLCLGLAPGVMPWGTLLALEESLGALNTTGLAVVQIANMWSVEG
nr:hypothetical protein [Tanacetum cinerariifolium]